MSTDILSVLSKIALAIATIVAIVRWPKLEEKGLRWFPLYMLFCVLIEAIVFFGGTGRLVRTYAYNTFDIVTYLFISFYFYQVLNGNKKVLFLSIGYMIALAVSFATESYSKTMEIQATAGTIITFLYTIIYFTSLLKSDALLDFFRLPSFWIAVGLLVFNLGYLPITFSLSAEILPKRETVYTIVTLVATLMYSCCTIAFLCKKKI